MGKTVARGVRKRNLIDALNADWDQLVACHRGAAAEWADRHPVLDGCGGLAHVLARVAAEPDLVLGALLAECAEGDQLAGRVVLQTMLGKIVRMAACDAEAGVDDYVSALWITISAYPLTARPRRIAANLALDTLKAVRQERQWLRKGEVTPYPPEAFVRELLQDAAGARGENGDEVDLDARRVIDAAQRLGLISGTTGEVLASVYADGLSGRAAGERHQTSPAAIRYRCSTTVRHLAKHAQVLADAA